MTRRGGRTIEAARGARLRVADISIMPTLRQRLYRRGRRHDW